tara:strand:+ start:66 stop:731 length:666 start_codon:yes stop_codon:yes gene_type:complete
MATIPNNPTIEQLDAVNEMLAAVSQAPVNQLEATNPEVALAFDTLMRTSREVQAEGWTFNIEYHVKQSRTNVTIAGVTETRIAIADDVIQIDLTNDHNNAAHNSVVRYDSAGDPAGMYLYDRQLHTFNWDYDPDCDVHKLFDYTSLPKPIQDYILARATAVFSNRLVGDTQQYQILKGLEAEKKAIALEYECSQGDFTFFGHPEGGNFYTSYQPYTALSRY